MKKINILNEELFLAEKIFEKAKGNMFRRKIKNILFLFNKEELISLHTFFVFNNIEAYWFNNKGVLIKEELLKPWSFYKGKRAYAVLEINNYFDKNKKNRFIKAVSSFIKNYYSSKKNNYK